jgi:hypothetical protein
MFPFNKLLLNASSAVSDRETAAIHLDNANAKNMVPSKPQTTDAKER